MKQENLSELTDTSDMMIQFNSHTPPSTPGSFYRRCILFKKIKQTTRHEEKFFWSDPVSSLGKPPEILSDYHPLPPIEKKRFWIPADRIVSEGFSNGNGEQEWSDFLSSLANRPSEPYPDEWLNRNFLHDEDLDCFSAESKFPENNKKEEGSLQQPIRMIQKEENLYSDQHYQVVANLCHGDYLNCAMIAMLLDQLAGLVSTPPARQPKNLNMMFRYAFQSIPLNKQRQFHRFLESTEADEMRKSLAAVIQWLKTPENNSSDTLVRAETIHDLLKIPWAIFCSRNGDGNREYFGGSTIQPQSNQNQVNPCSDIRFLSKENKQFLYHCGFRFHWLTNP